jgi:hypothetical protein
MWLSFAKLTPRHKKLGLAVLVGVLVLIALIVGLYYGLKSNSSKSASGTTQPAGSAGTTQPAGSAGTTQPAGSAGTTQPAGSAGTTQPAGSAGTTQPAGSAGTTQPAGSAGATQPSTTINIPVGQTDITTGKMIIYEPITLKALGTCSAGSTRFGFMDEAGELVKKEVSSDIVFPGFKIVLQANSLYLKRFEDSNHLKLWYITKIEGKPTNIIVDDFYGRILAYEQQENSSPIYKYMVWMDFSKVPSSVLGNWSDLPKTGFYNLHMNSANMKATMEYLDELYITPGPNKLNYVCKDSNPKSWEFNMKALSK